MALSRTCHQIYDEVSLTNLFYQVNHFDFRKSDDESVLAYLVAITDARRDNIQCVSMVWPLYDADSMAVIASCVKLKDFALHLPKEFVMYACFKRDNLVSFQEVKRAVQGLKKFKLILFNESKVEEVCKLSLLVWKVVGCKIVGRPAKLTVDEASCLQRGNEALYSCVQKSENNFKRASGN